MAGRQRSHHQVQEPWALRNALAILAAGGAGAILAFALSYWATDGDDKDRFDVGIKAATATAAIVAGVLTWGRLELSRGEQRLGVDRDLTERYGRAVDQLGDDETIIRVGGVFAMERFALDAMALSGFERDTDWRMALDLLADFAREHSADRDSARPPTTSPGDPAPDENSPGNLRDIAAPVDVAAAVRVLGRFAHRIGSPIEVHYQLNGIQATLAELADANLADASLYEANFTRANLGNANFTRAYLPRAILTSAYLGNANLSGAFLPYANLTSANLRGADLSDADLSDADLSDANLFGANLSDADLRDANLSDADLSDANLFRANLRDADLSDADLSGANLRDANLFGANLAGANFIGADLMGASRLDGVIYDEETTWPEGFEPPPPG